MAQSNTTITERACPAPFLPASNYPDTGGFVIGRFCAPFPSAGAEPFNCCLPCPHTDWVYQDNFLALTRVVNYINVAGMACCVFLLLSFAVLPTEKTHRHYLSVCVVLAIVLMNLGFIIPLGTKPKLCYNDITPHDMNSDITCALSGAALLAGGWYAVMWVFMRALSLHLQICWQVITGRKFFVVAQLAGWGIPAGFVAASLVVTGVSYRFGDTCHIKHNKGLEIFWVPLLTCGAAAIIVQFATFGYCIKVYLQSLMEERANSRESSALPSFNGSVRTTTAAQAYRRVRRVVRLQWRGIAVVLLIVTDAVFFAIIFVYLDQSTQLSGRNLDKARPWLFCLVLQQGDKNQCLKEARQVVLGEPAIMAVLILLSMNGIWCLLFLGRKSMFIGWKEWFAKQFRWRGRHPQEFVSIDARRFSSNPRTYEMLQSPSMGDKKTDSNITEAPSDLRAPERVFTPGSVSVTSEVHVTETVRVDYDDENEKQQERDATRPVMRKREIEEEEAALEQERKREREREREEEERVNDYFGAHPEDVIYRSPPQWSFSSPRPPKSPPRREWDPALTYAPSMSHLAFSNNGGGGGSTER